MQTVVVDQSSDRFYPLSQSRPLWDLFYGMYHAHQRIEKAFESVSAGELLYYVRDSLLELAMEQHPDKKIISSVSEDRTLFISPFLASFENLDLGKKNCVFRAKGRFAAAVLEEKQAAKYDGSEDYFLNPEYDVVELDVFIPQYIWEIMSRNGQYISRDYENAQCRSAVPEGLAIVGDVNRVTVADGVRIDPMVVIDSSKGPVYISSGCEINPFTRIEGPCFVGEDCVLLGTKLREGCSIGKSCRIGGEVEDSIFFPYANKYHDGFIGHAVIGSWVNLGALATNSDLKNDYSTVKLSTPYGVFDTGDRKIGCFIGDHSKCSIGTLMNTGTVIGSFAMTVHSGRMVREHLPSFSLFIKNSVRELHASSVTATAGTVMSRRNIAMGSAFKRHIERLFDETAENRIKEHEVINLREKR